MHVSGDPKQPGRSARAGRPRPVAFPLLSCALWGSALLFLAPPLHVCAQSEPAQPAASPAPAEAPRAAAARRFLQQRGWTPGRRPPLRNDLPYTSAPLLSPQAASATRAVPLAAGASSAAWTSLGPNAVTTPSYGLVTGRVTAVAFDPADLTGNRVYVGTTGGGVWTANNAATANPSSVAFTPLTESPPALNSAFDPSISIGALTVQPGATGVVLAGTGDPNDVLDSYYGAGILRSTDGGSTWSLIFQTNDLLAGLSTQNFSFLGEGFAGFAWSTVHPQVVVAAVSQAYEGAIVDATVSTASMQGLYYSQDSGATWHLATISDGSQNVQGPLNAFPRPDGNAATAVVWNPVRKLFIAAVRYHGYYQSADGVTWTRLANQPGTGLTLAKCPTNIGITGSPACPIFRGALAVNPQNGDTFAWTVDLNDQDQGLWQDQCGLSAGACSNPALTFAQPWNTAALETNTGLGAATIPLGSYNLALAAIPSGQTSLLLAGANDVWQSNCPLSQGCTWRNTTNSTTCMSAKVGEFQHVLAWPDLAWLNASSTQQAALQKELFVGNDSGLWRSLDAIAETGSACDPGDASHFQNLNGSIGSLAEIGFMSQGPASPYLMLAGLGVLGAAGVNAAGATSQWPQVLTGFGGPVAVDPQDPSTWYINDWAGVAIYKCTNSAGCTPGDFGSSPAVTNADVGNDGLAMLSQAPFLVDPVDHQQLLVATCRLWRGPASGTGWTSTNAISPILDAPASAGPCGANAEIRTLAAAPVTGGEKIYVGMYGATTGGGTLGGHILSATFDPSSGSMPAWHDLTRNPVSNDPYGMNHYGFDISSIAIDPHDPSGNTVYITVEGVSAWDAPVQPIYRSTDGGAHWNAITSNLLDTPANAVVVDPQDANTVYLATDAGVYYTTQASTCATAMSNCWSAFGTGLPMSPVIALSAGASAQVLVAGTYGRGIWQTSLATAATPLAAAAAAPASLAFGNQVYGATSAAQTVTVTNTGSVALASTSYTVSGNADDFGVSENCVGHSIAAGASCAFQVTFTPQAIGQRAAHITLYANVAGGELGIDLSGTGLAGGANVTAAPASLTFPQTQVGKTATPLQVTLSNLAASSLAISSVTVTPPFTLAANTCGTSLGSNSACQVQVGFAPTQSGTAAGQLAFTDAAGTQNVQLSGTGASPATDALSPASIAFPNTATGQVSTAQTVTITNSGDVSLQVTSIAASANFQQSSNCLSGVAAQSSCGVAVQFAPTQSGAITGTLTLTDALGSKTVSLSGSGVLPAGLAVTPTSLSFPQQQPGVASAPQTLTVTNNGGVPLAEVAFQFTGPAAASYAVASTTCGAVLNGGSQCTAQIVFTPAATGSISATLSIASSTSGVSAVQVSLNGSGQLTAAFQVSPSQLTFSAAVPVGQSSSAQSLTLTNGSNFAIDAPAVTVTAPFTLSQNTCTATLAAGAACTVAVVFTPAAEGAASGTLTIRSPQVAQAATVTLSGTGFSFVIASSGPASQTVTSGQQAIYKILLTPNGAPGTFTFQCGSLPANTKCVFNPTSETLAAGVQGNVQVQVCTGNSNAVTAQSEPQWLSGGLRLACVLVLLPLAWRRRRFLFLVLLAIAFAGGVSSCSGSGGGTTVGSGGGGGTGGGSDANRTPAGTYTVPVSITSSGLTQSVSLTLTVD